MTTYYENAAEYIENFDINAKIVDTEERDKMCEFWDRIWSQNLHRKEIAPIFIIHVIEMPLLYDVVKVQFHCSIFLYLINAHKMIC